MNRIGVNRFLRLNIRGKLAIAFAGLSILPLVVVGLLGLSSNVQTLHRVAIEDLSHDLLTIRERVRSFFGGMEENIEMVTSSSAFRQFVSAVQVRDVHERSTALAELLPELLSFAERKGIFFQIKFVDALGDEVFVIEQQDHGYGVVPASELNRGGTQFYLYLARQIPPNQATFLPVELTSRDFAKLFPGISCIYPVANQGLVGVFVFQLHAQSFFNIIEQPTPHSPAGKVMLVNGQGTYLYHSVKKKEWNKLLASKDVLNLFADYGPELGKELLSLSSPVCLEAGDEIVAHMPLFQTYPGITEQYTILKAVSKKEIFAPADTFRRIFLVSIGVFLMVSLVLAYLATRQFADPIKRLNREAQVIAQGDYHARVDVRTFDEIEDLAQQFNIMAASLEEREAKIEAHQRQLEKAVRKRTEELRLEKNKLQVILDNVPSGFVLLDPEYKIVSASAALEGIAGRPAAELLGRSCHEVIGDGQLCSDCPTERAFRSGRMHSSVEQHTAPDGEECYLEIISIPLKKEGRVENVLEIITDVTERKRLQEQLIRSERLAATGEMAAVIAHEMRNSLTSVRMILQLLAENEVLHKDDSESLEVALDSLGRMERVVKDLLQLARPERLRKASEDINAILLDSVEFARHQIDNQGIDLRIELAPEIPVLQLDREQIKEAFVNLILNASQAIEGEGAIEIRTRVETLGLNVRELGERRAALEPDEGVKVEEIILNKGKDVVVVEIKDSGCGIGREHLARIFDPFFTTKTNGTGLGLSFVKRVVNQHGGVIKVTSEKKRGSCFSILLPVG